MPLWTGARGRLHPGAPPVVRCAAAITALIILSCALRRATLGHPDIRSPPAVFAWPGRLTDESSPPYALEKVAWPRAWDLGLEGAEPVGSKSRGAVMRFRASVRKPPSQLPVFRRKTRYLIVRGGVSER